MSVAIKIDHAHKCYGSNVIIDDLSVRIREGEFFTLEELKQVFTIDGVSKSPAVFDFIIQI